MTTKDALVLSVIGSLTQVDLKSKRFERLEDGAGEYLRRQLEAQRPRFVAYAQWARIIDNERNPRETKIETLATIATRLSAQYPDPTELGSDADSLARVAIREADVRKEGTVIDHEKLRRFVADETNLAPLRERLRRLWAVHEPLPVARRDRGIEDDVLNGVWWLTTRGEGGKGRAMATTGASNAWDALVETFADEPIDSHAVTSLASSTVRIPELTGNVNRVPGSPPTTPFHPLDRSIESRVSRTLNREPGSYVMPARERFERMIDASVQPYGVPTPHGRAILHLGDLAYSALSAVASPRTRATKLRTGYQSLEMLWSRAAVTADPSRQETTGHARDSHSVATISDFSDDIPSSGAGSIGRRAENVDDVSRTALSNAIEDPMPLVMGILWRRVMNIAIETDAPIGAAEAWAIIRGAAVTAGRKLREVHSTRLREEPSDIAVRFLTRLFENDVIPRAVVTQLWNRIVASDPTRRLDDNLTATLREWAILVTPMGETKPPLSATVLRIRKHGLLDAEAHPPAQNTGDRSFGSADDSDEFDDLGDFGDGAGQDKDGSIGIGHIPEGITEEDASLYRQYPEMRATIIALYEGTSPNAHHTDDES